MQTPRVTLFADFGSPYRAPTGGYIFSEELLSILKELPITLTVFSVHYPVDKDFLIDPSLKNFHTISLPGGGLGSPLAGLLWSWKSRNALRNMPAQDLFVFDRHETWAGLFPRTPSLMTFHGSDFVRLKDFSFRHLRSSFYNLFWKKLFLNATQRSILNRSCGAPMLNSYDTMVRNAKDFQIPEESLRSYVTYLPVNVEKYVPRAEDRTLTRAKLHIAENEIVIMLLSSMNPIKGPERIPGIVKKVLAREGGARVKFLFVGGKHVPRSMHSILEDAEIKKRCIHVPEVSPEHVKEYYAAADIGLSTSHRESFGYFIAEGMVAKLPFVGYRGGAVGEVIEDGVTGFLADNEDVFVDRVVELLSDEARRKKMGDAGLHRVKNSFSREMFKKRLLAILEKDFRIRF